MRKRFTKSCALTLTAVMTLTGCGQASSDPSSAETEVKQEETAAEAPEEEASTGTEENYFDEPVTLSYLTWNYSDRTASTDAWIQGCKEKYNIDIEVQNVSSDQYGAAFKSKLAAEYMPDLVMVSKITPAYECQFTQITADTFIDISDLENIGNFNSEVVEGAKVNGTLYYLPCTENTIGVIYNESVFEENGLAVPTNIDEFYAVMDQLKDAGIAPLAGSFADAWSAQIIPFIAFDNYVVRDKEDVGIQLFNSETQESTLRWSDLGEGAEKALGLTNKWINEGYFTDDPLSTDASVAAQLLATGKAAMWITGVWEHSVVESAGDGSTKFRFFPLPLNEAGEETILPVTATEGICISSSSENVEAAKLALNYYLSDEIQNMVVADVLGIPTNNNVVVDSYFFDDILSAIDSSQICMNGFYGGTSMKGNLIPTTASFDRPGELVSLAGGYSTPEEFCEKMDKAIEEALTAE